MEIHISTRLEDLILNDLDLGLLTKFQYHSLFKTLKQANVLISDNPQIGKEIRNNKYKFVYHKL